MARIAFLGSPDAAVTCLEALVEAGHQVDVVVSQPDKRRGRGGSSSPSPVKQAALALGLEVTDRLADVVDCGAEIAVVVAYGKLVPARILEALPMLNAHFSLLPRWRGAAPVERAILAGDSVTGVCIMRLEEGLDTGPVLLSRSVEIDHESREHASALTARLARVAADLLVETFSAGVARIGPGSAQVGEAVYAPKLEPAELYLDFSTSVVELERRVRLDRAWTTFRGERLIVLDAIGRATGNGGGASPGVDDLGRLDGTSVVASDGLLELLKVQPAGRRPVDAASWVRGARLGPEERLG
jgi:methionyl-tRNA formyltransferase